MDYVICNSNQDELYHYGVLGMKWGVRRASKALSKATTPEKTNKAVNKLNKHREKATNKIAKLEKKHPKLKANVDRAIITYDPKAIHYKRKADRYQRKANKQFFTNDFAKGFNQFQANKYSKKAENYYNKSAAAKSYLAKNERMTQLFKEGVSTIDSTLVAKGKNYVK